MTVMAFASRCLPALAVALAVLSGAAGAAGVVDDRGVKVTLASTPRRIVSLMPSLTETVCALGACDRLVAVDRFSDYPASVRTLPRAGGLGDTDLERVVAARPDLVLVAPSARVAERLESFGVTVAAFDARTIDDVRRVLEAVASLIDTGDPQRVWREVGARIDAAAQAVPASVRGMKVYVEVDDGYAAGEGSYFGELLARLGLRDVVPASMGPYPHLNPEFVVRADPQWLLFARSGGTDAAARPGWSGIDAVKRQRICRFDARERDVLVRPGPRVGEAAWTVVQCLKTAAWP